MEEAISLELGVCWMPTQSRKQATFEDLYVAYFSKVYNYVCYRVSDIAVAEDITAEVFERALKSFHTYRPERAAFSTWIFRIAHNLVANHYRDSSRKPQLSSWDVIKPVVGEARSPEQATIVMEQQRTLQEKIRGLPRKQQEVLALKFGAGLSYEDIAKTMRIRSNYVGVLLHRAVRALRLALEEEVVI
jgi:RNA polymerase sigma factor (sigma-70 family)